ncbi:MAG TPA: P1 family peptidase [Xanthobacteraceae bacterium]
MKRSRLRDLGIAIGRLSPGRNNAITDVAGVRVGYSTLCVDKPHVLRTGVTVVWPQPDIFRSAVFAGSCCFNGYGELTGALWLAEQGLLTSPIALTNTCCVGAVRDALCAYAVNSDVRDPTLLPVVTETDDCWLSESETFPITREQVFAALEGATGGRIAEGNVGGGTGSICHELKGGTGTASRVVRQGKASWIVGALVQANYGLRSQLTVGGMPVGRELKDIPSAYDEPDDKGSIIVVLATTAPLLGKQCERVARRAALGLGRVGSIGANSSGDIFLCFSVHNRVPQRRSVHRIEMLDPCSMDGLFAAAVEATEEAILNALTAAETTVGRDGRTAHALPLDALTRILAPLRFR